MKYIISLLAIIGLAGCVASVPQAVEKTEKNRLTTGQVQITLRKNETTQAEVVEVFGSPNLVTTNGDGDEVWTYQRHATVANASSSSVYGTIILFGASSNAAGFEQSTRTMTLIIKFKELNGVKRVSDFSSRSSSF